MMKNKEFTKNKISQLFAMRTAIAKSRYKNPVGFFRGAQAINRSAHSFPGQDSGFPVPSDSQESSERTRTKRTWSDCPSVRRTCRKYIYQGVPMEDSKKSTSNTNIDPVIVDGGSRELFVQALEIDVGVVTIMKV